MSAAAANKRRICVVTGTRAEYGLLQPLMREIDDDRDLAFQLVVTGAHLEPRFGETAKVIEEDGFVISARVPSNFFDDRPLTVAKSLGSTATGLAEEFARLAPDCIVVLGDRIEVLAAVEAALVLRIPVAHIHGGEATEGAFDESIRHAVTKMSHLHFAAAEDYRRRIIQLGEQPNNVHMVGALCLDSLSSQVLLDRAGLADRLAFDIKDTPYFLVTYHPVTLSRSEPSQSANELLAALDEFSDIKVLVTGANADPRNEQIAALMQIYQDRFPDRVQLHPSLGQCLYYSAMKHAAVVIGNSSSGIIEAPMFSVPTVNIGTRQGGRIRAASIIDCPEDSGSIAIAIRKSVNPGFRAVFEKSPFPFGTPGAAQRIKNVLKAANLEEMIVKKFRNRGLFGDIPFET